MCSYVKIHQTIHIMICALHSVYILPKKLLKTNAELQIVDSFSQWHELAVLKLLSVYPAAAAAAKLLQSCPTLCDSMDGSPPGSPIPGILQARILEWVAISFSNA